MAEVVNPNGTGGEPNQNGAGNNPEGQQAQEPAWISSVPEQHREEARKSYLLHGDYTKKTSELSEQRKSWETKEKEWAAKEKNWADFQSQYDPFRRQLETHWKDIEPILKGQAARAAIEQSPQEDPFKDFDLLPATEQAKRLADYTQKSTQAAYEAALNKQEEKFNATIGQHVEALRKYLAVQTNAYEKKFQNPELNLNEYLQTALQASNGQIDPFEYAYSTVTAKSSQQKMQEEWMRKGREERDLELKNQNIAPGGFNNQSLIPKFGQKPDSRQAVAEAVRAEALKKGIGWS